MPVHLSRDRILCGKALWLLREAREGTSEVYYPDGGRVELTWTQNDVTDLAGYVLCRSPYTIGYTRADGGMFATTDTDVTSGVNYYYRYSGLDTDFNAA